MWPALESSRVKLLMEKTGARVSIRVSVYCSFLVCEAIDTNKPVLEGGVGSVRWSGDD